MQLSLVVDAYYCRECLAERGERIEALVLAMPRAAVMNGKLIGDPFWCCPECRRPKFFAKGKKNGRPCAAQRKDNAAYRRRDTA